MSYSQQITQDDALVQVGKSTIPLYLRFIEAFVSHLLLPTLPCFEMWSMCISRSNFVK